MQLRPLHLGQSKPKKVTGMRSSHLGLLHLGQFKPNYDENNKLEACTYGYYTWGILERRKQRKEKRSMHLGRPHLRQGSPMKANKTYEACACDYCTWGNSKQSKDTRSRHLGLLHMGQLKQKEAKKRNEKHAPEVTASGAIQTKESEEKK